LVCAEATKVYLEKRTKAAEVNPDKRSRKEWVATSKTRRGQIEESKRCEQQTTAGSRSGGKRVM